MRNEWLAVSTVSCISHLVGVLAKTKRPVLRHRVLFKFPRSVELGIDFSVNYVKSVRGRKLAKVVRSRY